MTENRRFSRIPFKVRAELQIQGQTHSAEEIINLGVGGCLLPLPLEHEAGTPCLVRIRLEGTNDATVVSIEGSVVRTVANGLAIQFTRIDPDSLFHLRNIIRYNAPDADAIENEISRHPGLK